MVVGDPPEAQPPAPGVLGPSSTCFPGGAHSGTITQFSTLNRLPDGAEDRGDGDRHGHRDGARRGSRTRRRHHVEPSGAAQRPAPGHARRGAAAAGALLRRRRGRRDLVDRRGQRVLRRRRRARPRRVRRDPASDPISPEAAGAALAASARMVVALHEGPKISIAALPGPAVGAGVGIALAADLRIAAESARLIPGWGRARVQRRLRRPVVPDPVPRHVARAGAADRRRTDRCPGRAGRRLVQPGRARRRARRRRVRLGAHDRGRAADRVPLLQGERAAGHAVDAAGGAAPRVGAHGPLGPHPRASRGGAAVARGGRQRALGATG